MMNCQQATQLLSEKLDRPLTRKEKMAIGMHTTLCPSCRQFGKQMEELRHISKSYTKGEVPETKK
ncbi:zf-HC2 domain-containing protein [Marinomonas hwangdonensis]|uniref:Zf-HC2 domain-containing protein n=1 Tax=Marinomonas hwangdonensis TaxID=1053647 RepID=A0A3M8Q5X6_9GAMM|nr:zf-HC2 domain-containing protein [Marinomonas hwangdonensis]RNF51528.1 zf-HC2 domain-containing protein [Marinomonas hwangdonensis]